MGFSKDQIKAAKQGKHSVKFSTNFADVSICEVAKVSGETVWVTCNGKTIKLNKTASEMLMQGKFR